MKTRTLILSASLLMSLSLSALADTTIHIANFAFAPASTEVNTGSTVTWTNDDSAHHSLISNDNLFTSQALAQGESYSYKFTTPGTYTYHCGIHHYMVGTVTVK